MVDLSTHAGKLASARVIVRETTPERIKELLLMGRGGVLAIGALNTLAFVVGELDALEARVAAAEAARAKAVRHDESRVSEYLELEEENARLRRPNITTFDEDGEWVMYTAPAELVDEKEMLAIRNVAVALRWFFVGVSHFELRRARAKVAGLEAMLPDVDEVALVGAVTNAYVQNGEHRADEVADAIRGWLNRYSEASKGGA